MERASETSTTTAESIRGSFVWAGLLLGLAIVLKDVIAATDFTYVSGVVLVAWAIDQFRPLPARLASSKWGAVLQAVAIIIVAVVIRIVMES